MIPNSGFQSKIRIYRFQNTISKRTGSTNVIIKSYNNKLRINKKKYARTRKTINIIADNRIGHSG